jgi:hypothetical protein
MAGTHRSGHTQGNCVASPFFRRSLVSFVIVANAIALHGCAGLPLAMFTIAAGTGTGAGVGHTLDSITYKTFAVPLTGLGQATVMTLDRLDMPVMEIENTEEGQTITALAGDRTIEVELDRLTTTATRMRVVAKKNFLIRDRATATEIIMQTDRTLSDHPYLAKGEVRPAQPVARSTQRCVKGGASC